MNETTDPESIAGAEIILSLQFFFTPPITTVVTADYCDNLEAAGSGSGLIHAHQMACGNRTTKAANRI